MPLPQARPPVRRSLPLLLVLACATTAPAQVGELLWAEDFNSLDNWMVVTGNGQWGWGNGELQFYQEDNVQIAEIAGEAGNMALRIQARAQSGPGIVDQWGNALAYTSGKVSTKAKVSLHYGMIEARVKVPNLDLGGWPALWLLGTANYTWPRCGELDMMEMGHQRSFRDLHDSHNGGDGSNSSTVNQMVGANAIAFREEAVTPENPSGASSLAWDPQDIYCRPYYNLEQPLVDRFLVYRFYWDEVSLRFTVEDQGQERDLFESPHLMDEASSEFQQPFYLIANLALGGALTDAWDLGDPGSGLPVSMPLPATMEVDYIRVYEWNGQGEVHVGPPDEESGSFGVFTDTTPVQDAFVVGETAEIYVWEGTLQPAELPPFEGDNGLAWATTGQGWFGAGIMAIQPLNLFAFGEGSLRFHIQIPPQVSFKIGIIDAWGNQNYVPFPAHQSTWGLVRDGAWGQATIPVSVLRGPWMDLRMLSYAFVILEENGTACQFALDDIIWVAGESGVKDSPQVAGPGAFHLGTSPNPFNPSTEIRFQLERAAQVRLAIHTLDGGLVAVLEEGRLPAGGHTSIWRAAGQPSGAYLVSLDVDGKRETQKCLLVK
jgi:beta-glucanase (GH16 family)